MSDFDLLFSKYIGKKTGLHGYKVTNDINIPELKEKCCNQTVTDFDKKVTKPAIEEPKPASLIPEYSLKIYKNNELSPDKPKDTPKPCCACGSCQFWQLPPSGPRICGCCHPPANLKAAWIDCG